MNGGQFQPPGLPPQMPDYQGGINQPPLNQDNGISIYNTGAPQQVGQQAPGQQDGQQPESQQPQHGTQIPDYQTATPYTQGPGKANPDYQAPQQGNQAQQPQQGNQQPASQAPTQTQVPTQSQPPTETQGPGQQDGNQSDSDKMEKHEGDNDKSKECPGNVTETPNSVEVKNADPFRNHGRDSNSVVNRELKYSVDTKWSSEFNKAMDAWKKFAGDKIKFTEVPKSNQVEATLVIQDQQDVSGNEWKSGNSWVNAMWTHLTPPKIIWTFYLVTDHILTNAPIFEELTESERISTFGHEIGHALGMDHSCENTLMYYQVLPLYPPEAPTAIDKAIFNIIWP
ncbi:matrixin family protein [Mycobacteroides chelonae]|nr:matrixin family protein [Mycobacteroides chelonae]